MRILIAIAGIGGTLTMAYAAYNDLPTSWAAAIWPFLWTLNMTVEHS